MISVLLVAAGIIMSLVGLCGAFYNIGKMKGMKTSMRMWAPTRVYEEVYGKDPKGEGLPSWGDLIEQDHDRLTGFIRDHIESHHHDDEDYDGN